MWLLGHICIYVSILLYMCIVTKLQYTLLYKLFLKFKLFLLFLCKSYYNVKKNKYHIGGTRLVTFIIFFSVPGGSKLSKEFASKLGRHAEKTLGKDIGVDKLIKEIHSSKNSLGDKLGSASTLLRNLEALTQGMHLLKRVHIGLTKNGTESVTNSEDDHIPFISESETRPLGKNMAQYMKINTHIGHRTKGKLKRIKNNSAFIETETKILADSQSDYISSKKRSQLIIKSGFNEKNFTFFLDDTYLSVEDYYNLFNVKKRFEKQIKKNKNEDRKLVGGALKTKHQFKLKNRIDYFTCHVKIHLLKITDLEYDIKKLLNESLHTKNSSTFNNPGKIPRNLQLSEPNFSKDNKISSQFLTTLNCNLKDSSKFLERCKIVKTWSRTLSSGSTLEFNLTHNLGHGISINQLVDLIDISKSKEGSRSSAFIDEALNILEQSGNRTTAKTLKETIGEKVKDQKPEANILNHPTGFIFAIETVGDRRASIVNEKNDVFSGYSPVLLNFEFKTELSYICDQDDENELLVYVKKDKNKQFNETSEFPEIFYPERQDKFHVKFNDIDFNGTGKAKWRLEYDQSIKAAGDINESISTLKNLLDSMGISYDKVVGDDGINFNFKKDPDFGDETNAPAQEPRN